MPSLRPRPYGQPCRAGDGAPDESEGARGRGPILAVIRRSSVKASGAALPPKGVRASSHRMGVLMWQMPDSIRFATPNARAMPRERTAADSSHSASFATRTACSSPVPRTAVAIGPESSPPQARIAGATLSRMVAGMVLPLAGPPQAGEAPLRSRH